MAIFHLSVKPLSRKGGRSATAASAYRSGEKVQDYTTGETFDYTHRSGVEYTEIVLPTDAARQDINWARDRQDLWNAAEQAENRSNSRVAREYEIALPHELSPEARIELVQVFSQDLADRFGVAVDVAIHAPHWHGDERNHHAHLLTTTRVIEPGGLGEKSAIEWSDTNRRKAGLAPAKKEIQAIRAQWEARANEKLLEVGLSARIDHRSLEAQGIERTPTVHLGPAVSGLERRGIDSEVGKRIAWEREQAQQQRLERAAELGGLEREGLEVSKSILDLSGDLAAAKRERALGQGFGQSLERKPSKGTFDGLILGASDPSAERGARAGRTAEPMTSPPGGAEFEPYARALADAQRMRAQGLPVLEHQTIELQRAGEALERAQPGALADVNRVKVYEPERLRGVLGLEGPERGKGLQELLKAERDLRTNPSAQAERVARTWAVLEQERELQRGIGQGDTRAVLEGRFQAIIQDVKQDGPLGLALAREIGLPPKSRTLEIPDRLERVVRAPTLERALEWGTRERGLYLSR